MNVRTVVACLVFASTALGRGGGADMVDSLPISGHYVQNGRLLSPRSLEKGFLAGGPSATYADGAKGYRLTGKVIGASLWTASFAVSAVQFAAIYNSLKKGEMMTSSSDRFTMPLLIGGEIGSFIQGRLYSRSGYLLHKGVLAFNRNLCEKRGLELEYSHHITKPKKTGTWYHQDGLAMPVSTLYHVLREQPESRGGAIRSWLYRETASHVISFGTTFIALALLAAIDDEVDGVYLGTGIGLTSFGIVNAISAVVARNKAIRQYNAAVPERVPCRELP